MPCRIIGWLLASWLGCAAGANGYPAKPIRLLVPFPSGSTMDQLASTLAPKLAAQLGQPVRIENRQGAAGAIGSELATRAAPDGYTLLFATTATHSLGPVLKSSPPYQVATDFTPIIWVATSPNIVLVPMSSPARTMRAFIDYAHQHPGLLNYASSGQGGLSHLATESFMLASGTAMKHIPYRASDLAKSDLISGQLDFMVDSLLTSQMHLNDGKLRVLAVTSLQASALVPGRPTLAEVLPGYESSTWFGLYGPRALPADITLKLNQAVNRVLRDADLKAQWARWGAEPMGGSPQALADWVRSDTAKWKKLATERQIRTD